MNTSPLERIVNAHNPEFDVIPGGPKVTWASADLATIVLELIENFDKLEAKLNQLTANQTITCGNITTEISSSGNSTVITQDWPGSIETVIVDNEEILTLLKHRYHLPTWFNKSHLLKGIKYVIDNETGGPHQ